MSMNSSVIFQNKKLQNYFLQKKMINIFSLYFEVN